MNVLQIILLVAVSLSGYPAGLLIASQTKEELKDGSKWFNIIMIACSVLFLLSIILASGDALLLMIASLAFVFLMSLASLIYSYNLKKK